MYVFSFYSSAGGLPYLSDGGMFDPQIGGDLWAGLGSYGSTGIDYVACQFCFCIAAISVAPCWKWMSQDYNVEQPGKGIAASHIVYLHALKTPPSIVTVIGLDLPFLLGGAVVTERILHGRARGACSSITCSVVSPVVMGILMIIAVAVVVFQILRYCYAWLDPRIRYD